MAVVYLGLGANLGNRAANIRLALRMLAPGAAVLAVSRLYESPPADGSEQPPYYNAAARAETALTPEELLGLVKRIEHAIGRRSGRRWGPRVIDIDILAYADLALDAVDLTLPHPRIAERAFVVRPLLDLDPDLEMPRIGRLKDLRVAGESLAVVDDAFPSASTVEGI